MPSTQVYPPIKDLTGVTSTGASSTWHDVSKCTNVAVLIEASSVTTGGTMLVEAQDSGGTAVTLHSEAVEADGDTWVEFDTPVTAVRTNLSARTDGTYTTTIFRRVGSS
jgi:hypothetical protein